MICMRNLMGLTPPPLICFCRDDVLPPPRSFEAVGSSPSSLWGDFTEDHEMGMCVSVDPDSGYRWNTRYCNGPDKAAFICQIPGKKTRLPCHGH
jgi:hypothetical protein